MPEPNNGEDNPRKDIKGIEIMADYGDAYAWAIRDIHCGIGGGECSPLSYLFPDVPGVKEIDKALLDWECRFSIECDDLCDLRFDFEAFHEEGVALAERLAKAVKHTGVRIFYSRPYEDPNTSPKFEVGEGIARPPQRLFEILDPYRVRSSSDKSCPNNVDYVLKTSSLPAIERKIRDNIELVIGEDLTAKIIGAFRRILSDDFATGDSYAIPVVWGNKYCEAPGVEKFFSAMRAAVLAPGVGRFSDFLSWFTVYPGIMNFCPSSMVSHLELNWRHCGDLKVLGLVGQSAWIFVGEVKSALYYMTRDMDFADASGYLFWDILKDYAVTDEKEFDFILKDEREGKQQDHTSELIRRFKAGLLAIRPDGFKFAKEIGLFCSEDQIAWIGRWRYEKEWSGSDDLHRKEIADLVRKKVVDEIEYYSGSFWKPESEWGDELVGIIRRYADAQGKERIRVDEKLLKTCIESKVLYDRMARKSVSVKSYLNLEAFEGEPDIAAARLINEIMVSGAVVFQKE